MTRFSCMTPPAPPSLFCSVAFPAYVQHSVTVPAFFSRRYFLALFRNYPLLFSFFFPCES